MLRRTRFHCLFLLLSAALASPAFGGTPRPAPMDARQRVVLQLTGLR
jgi:hypothetical protein